MELCGAAAAASGHPARFIEWNMSKAEALQYQALWLEMQGNTTEALHSAALTAKQVL